MRPRLRVAQAGACLCLVRVVKPCTTELSTPIIDGLCAHILSGGLPARHAALGPRLGCLPPVQAIPDLRGGDERLQAVHPQRPRPGKLRPVFTYISIRAHLHVLFLSLFLSGTQASPPSTLPRACPSRRCSTDRWRGAPPRASSCTPTAPCRSCPITASARPTTAGAALASSSRFLLRLPALARKEGRDRWARASICTWRRRRRSSARSSGSPRTSPRATRWRSTV